MNATKCRKQSSRKQTMKRTQKFAWNRSQVLYKNKKLDFWKRALFIDESKYTYHPVSTVKLDGFNVKFLVVVAVSGDENLEFVEKIRTWIVINMRIY